MASSITSSASSYSIQLPTLTSSGPEQAAPAAASGSAQPAAGSSTSTRTDRTARAAVTEKARRNELLGKSKAGSDRSISTRSFKLERSPSRSSVNSEVGPEKLSIFEPRPQGYGSFPSFGEALEGLSIGSRSKNLRSESPPESAAAAAKPADANSSRGSSGAYPEQAASAGKGKSRQSQTADGQPQTDMPHSPERSDGSRLPSIPSSISIPGPEHPLHADVQQATDQLGDLILQSSPSNISLRTAESPREPRDERFLPSIPSEISMGHPENPLQTDVPQSTERHNALSLRSKPSRISARTVENQPQTGMPQAPEQRDGQSVSSRPSGRSMQTRLIDRLRQNANAPDAQGGIAPFPKNVQAWQAAIHAQKTRPIDLDTAAEVLNEIRFNPHKPDAIAGTIPSHSELKGRITQEQVDRWNRALGLSEAHVKAMDHLAFWGGTTVPLNNTFFNALSFALVPMLQYLSKDMKSPWAQAGVGLGIVAAQPFLSSVVQTYAVASLEVWRQKRAPSVQLDKSSINASRTPRELAAEIDRASQALRESTAELNNLMRSLAQAQEIAVPEGAAAFGEDQLGQILGAATPDQKQQLQQLHKRNAADLLRLGELVVAMQKADGGQDRAKHLNAWQIIPRTARAGSRLPAAVLTGVAADSVRNSKHPLERINISGISVGVAMGFQLLQHLAAAYDEVAGQNHDHKMNMLYANVFTEEGAAAWKSGQSAILPEHLDENKLRGLVELPETQMAKRVTKLIDGRLKEAKALLDKNKAAAQANTQAPAEADTEAPAEKTDLEAAAPAKGTLEKRISELELDLEQLRAGNLEKLSKGGDAWKLVNSVMKDPAFGYAMTESRARMTPLEFTAQLGQRIAQSFTFVAAGSAAAVTSGPVLTAVLGGNEKVPNGAKIAIALGNMAVGAFSAATQYMVINVKNNRRDGGKMSFLDQLWQGMISPVISAKDYLASGRGRKTAEGVFHEHRRAISESLDTLINKAKEPKPMPGAWPESEDEVPEVADLPSRPESEVEMPEIADLPPLPESEDEASEIADLPSRPESEDEAPKTRDLAYQLPEVLSESITASLEASFNQELQRLRDEELQRSRPGKQQDIEAPEDIEEPKDRMPGAWPEDRVQTFELPPLNAGTEATTYFANLEAELERIMSVNR